MTDFKVMQDMIRSDQMTPKQVENFLKDNAGFTKMYQTNNLGRNVAGVYRDSGMTS